MNIYTVSWGFGKDDKKGHRLIESPMTVAVVRTEKEAFKEIEERNDKVINTERYYIDERLIFVCECAADDEGTYDTYTIEKWEV